uniref:Uncharacterized protein n=1 Tax=Oryza brachyantha TaxID=4533 RepID=J3M6B3_ORYBR
MASISHLLVAMLLSSGFGFIVAAQMIDIDSSSQIPTFNVVDGGKKLSTSGSDQIHHILPHHGTVPGPSDPLGPPSDVIGDGKRLSPTRLNLDHHGLPPLNPPSNVIGVIGIDGENRFSIAGSDQIHHILPHHGTVPGPSDPLGPPSDVIGDGMMV